MTQRVGGLQEAVCIVVVVAAVCEVASVVARLHMVIEAFMVTSPIPCVLTFIMWPSAYLLVCVFATAIRARICHLIFS